MKHYYVNTQEQSTSEHEVHTEDCFYLPKADKRKYLGYFDNCKEAIKKAKEFYDNVDGCKFCSPECHTK